MSLYRLNKDVYSHDGKRLVGFKYEIVKDSPIENHDTAPGNKLVRSDTNGFQFYAPLNALEQVFEINSPVMCPVEVDRRIVLWEKVRAAFFVKHPTLTEISDDTTHDCLLQLIKNGLSPVPDRPEVARNMACTMQPVVPVADIDEDEKQAWQAVVTHYFMRDNNIKLGTNMEMADLIKLAIDEAFIDQPKMTPVTRRAAERWARLREAFKKASLVPAPEDEKERVFIAALDKYCEPSNSPLVKEAAEQWGHLVDYFNNLTGSMKERFPEERLGEMYRAAMLVHMIPANIKQAEESQRWIRLRGYLNKVWPTHGLSLTDIQAEGKFMSALDTYIAAPPPPMVVQDASRDRWTRLRNAWQGTDVGQLMATQDDKIIEANIDNLIRGQGLTTPRDMRRIKKTLAAIAAAFAVTGCTSLPQYSDSHRDTWRPTLAFHNVEHVAMADKACSDAKLGRPLGEHPVAHDENGVELHKVAILCDYPRIQSY